jgi:hypothetical protein
MYRAKKMGRNNTQFYQPAMNEESLERVRIESALRNALERNEFVLHYQPQVDLKAADRRHGGADPLASSELGMVSPRTASSAWPRKPADRADRRLGAAHRLRAEQGMAGRRPGALRRRQPVGAPVQRTETGGVGIRRAAPTPACRRPAWSSN